MWLSAALGTKAKTAQCDASIRIDDHSGLSPGSNRLFSGLDLGRPHAEKSIVDSGPNSGLKMSDFYPPQHYLLPSRRT
jgi:hypothetical protein